MSTYLTERQVKVLKLLSQGLSIDEIAHTLGVSRSNIYALIRSAKRVVSKSANTVKLYNELTGNNAVIVYREISINDAIMKILAEANSMGVKIPLTTAELILKLVKSVDDVCIDLINSMIKCNLVFRLDPTDGVVIDRFS